MARRSSSATLLTLVAVCVCALIATAASAQYRPLGTGSTTKSSGSSDNPKGEPYHVEFAYNIWEPVPAFVVASSAFGIPGTDIDVQATLSIQKKRTYEIRLFLRPGKRHKFRFHYLPLAYTGSTRLTSEIIFNGIRFPISADVATDLSWTTYRIGYEFDFVSNPHGYLGFILEAKYTDAQVQLRSFANEEYVRARAPIPAIGASGRVYLGKFASITGEVTFFKLPSGIQGLEQYHADYLDYDIYGTVNFTDNFGIQGGYRTLDLRYSAEQDRGQARLKGPYFGGVARF